MVFKGVKLALRVTYLKDKFIKPLPPECDECMGAIPKLLRDPSLKIPLMPPIKEPVMGEFLQERVLQV